MMIVWILLVKTLKEQFREWRMIVGLITLPLMFMFIFGFFFGKDYYTYPISFSIENRGDGAVISRWQELLAKQDYGNGVKIFKLMPSCQEAVAVDRLRKRDLAAYIRIPAQFAAAMAALRGGVQTPAPLTVEVLGDPSNALFGMVQIMVRSSFDEFLMTEGMKRTPFDVQAKYLSAASKNVGEFTYIAPGLMLTAIFLLLIQCAMVVVREVQSGVMMRLQMSSMKIWQFMMAMSLSQLVIAALMLPVMFASAVMVGFESGGSWLSAFIIGLLTSLSAVAFGLITAGLSKTVMEAFLWGNLFSIPVVFMSGAFFPIPEMTLFSIGSFTLLVDDLIPTRQAMKAMSQVLIYGQSLGDVWPNLLSLLISSIVLLLLGWLLFSRTHMKRI